MSTLRVGVIGCGAIGRDHIRRLHDVTKGVTLTAVSDISVKNGEKTANQYHVSFYRDGKELIRANDVDAVVIASIDETHAEFVLEAIKCGKYVLCEKPLAPTIDECRQIVDAEIKSGKQYVQVGFTRRYDNSYRKLKEELTSGRCGEPLLLHCRHRNAFLADYYVTPMLITNCCIHEIDISRWLLEEEYVGCQVVLGRKTQYTEDKLHDPIIVMLKTESGVSIDAEIFGNAKYGYDIRCEAVCELGEVSLTSMSDILVCTEKERRRPIHHTWEDRFIEAYDVEFQEWVDAIAVGGKFNGPSSWDGYMATRTSNACVKALESGRYIEIEKLECPAFYSKIN